MNIQGALQIAAVIVSVLLTILILLQVKGGGLGSLLGGDAGGGITRTRRGLEKNTVSIDYCHVDCVFGDFNRRRAGIPISLFLEHGASHFLKVD